MTQDEKRVKIAEACGKLKRSPGEIVEHQRWDAQTKGVYQCVRFPDGSLRPCYSQPLPDYFGDLNACQEMEKGLIDWQKYLKELFCIVNPGASPDEPCHPQNFFSRKFVTATAAQRAEAFGLTLSLWEPESKS